MRGGRWIVAASAVVCLVAACRDWDQYAVETQAAPVGGAGVGGLDGGGGDSSVGGGGAAAGGSGGSGPTACGFIDALSDDFDDGIKRDAVWADGAGDGGLAFVMVGAYALALDADDSWASFETESAYDLTGRTLTLDIAELSLGSEQGMWFSVGTDSDNYVEFWIQSGFVGFGREIDGTYQLVGPNVGFGYPDVHWLRFREAGDTIHFETSSDGVDFDVLAETLAVFDVRHTYVSVGAEGNGLGTSGLVRIDSISGGPTAGSLCKTESFSDDFDDGQRDPAWDDWSDDLCDMFEIGGQLVVDVGVGASGDDCGSHARHAFDFTGSKASVEVVDLPSGAEMWLHVSDPDQDNGVGFFVDDGTMFVVILASGNDTELQSLPFDAQAHRWLQLREAGGQVFWEVSADGQSWTEVHVATAAIALSHMSIYVGAGASGLVSSPLSVSLDNFNIMR